jgi:hypothetical protein
MGLYDTPPTVAVPAHRTVSDATRKPDSSVITSVEEGARKTYSGNSPAEGDKDTAIENRRIEAPFD